MSRPTDWSPLGYDRDPVPGDPLTVSGAAITFQEIANEIKKAETHLRNISVNGQGKAIHKIRQKCDELAGRIQKAHTICDGVDDALKPYVEVLETAQEKSLKELECAEGHQAAGNRMRQRQESIKTQYHASRESRERDELRYQFNQLQMQVSHEKEQVDAARRRLQAVIDERNVAAKTAASRLRGVLKDSGLKDSWWDKICGVVRNISKWLEQIKPWLDKLSDVLSVVSIVVACIPGLQGVAAVLKLVSLGVAAASLATGLMVNGRKLMDGDMGWGEFLFSSGMDVLSVVGAAKSAKGATKAAKQMFKGAGQAGKAFSSSAEHIADKVEWAARTEKLRKLSPVRQLPGKAWDIWDGTGRKKAVLDRYGRHLVRKGVSDTVGSGVKYSLVREGLSDLYDGTHDVIKDYGCAWLGGRENDKALWKYYAPGKVLSLTDPVK